jgi:hypothetical protein
MNDNECTYEHHWDAVYSAMSCPGCVAGSATPDGLDFPEWVNDGRSFFDCFVEAVHIALWEQQLEDPT